MQVAWAIVHRATSTATPNLIGSEKGFLLWGVRAVNAASGTVTIGIGGTLVWEFNTATAVDSDMFYVPIHFGAINPTITIGGTATAYVYYSLY